MRRLAAALIVCAGAARVQAAPLGLRETLTRVAEVGPDQAVAQSLVPVAQAEVRSARMYSPNPTIGLNGGRSEPVAAALLTLRLPILGQRGAHIRAAERGSGSRPPGGRRALWRLRHDARIAYYAVARADEEVAIARRGGAAHPTRRRHRGRALRRRRRTRLKKMQASAGPRRCQQDVDRLEQSRWRWRGWSWRGFSACRRRGAALARRFAGGSPDATPALGRAPEASAVCASPEDCARSRPNGAPPCRGRRGARRSAAAPRGKWGPSCSTRRRAADDGYCVGPRGSSASTCRCSTSTAGPSRAPRPRRGCAADQSRSRQRRRIATAVRAAYESVSPPRARALLRRRVPAGGDSGRADGARKVRRGQDAACCRSSRRSARCSMRGSAGPKRCFARAGGARRSGGGQRCHALAPEALRRSRSRVAAAACGGRRREPSAQSPPSVRVVAGARARRRASRSPACSRPCRARTSRWARCRRAGRSGARRRGRRGQIGQPLAHVEARAAARHVSEAQAQREQAAAAGWRMRARGCAHRALFRDGIVCASRRSTTRAPRWSRPRARSRARGPTAASPACSSIARRLRAPIAGVVAAILVPAGQPVDGNGTPVIEIADTARARSARAGRRRAGRRGHRRPDGRARGRRRGRGRRRAVVGDRAAGRRGDQHGDGAHPRGQRGRPAARRHVRARRLLGAAQPGWRCRARRSCPAMAAPPRGGGRRGEGTVAHRAFGSAPTPATRSRSRAACAGRRAGDRRRRLFAARRHQGRGRE